LGEIEYLRARRSRSAEWVRASSLRFSVFANLVWRIWDGSLVAESVRVQERVRGNESAMGGDYQNTGPPFEYASEEELVGELAGIWSRASRQIHALCSANRIEYYHFLQPNQYVAPSKPMSEAERRIAFVGSARYEAGARDGYPALKRHGVALRGAGVRFTDLTAIFERVEERIYRDGCCHVNRAGNEILARAISDRIAAER
jgi:hypothetical protein